MVKVLFITDNLAGGGAERVLVNLVNFLDRTKYDITVRTMFAAGVNHGRLHKDINYTEKNAPCFKGISIVCRFIPCKWLYRYFVGKEKYDIVVAYLEGVPTRVVAGAPAAIKKIAWLHNENIDVLYQSFGGVKKTARKLKNFDAIVGVSKTVIQAFSQKTGINDNVYVCYNTNDTDEILEKSQQSVVLPDFKRPLLCSVGKFGRQKGFERLMKISARLEAEGVNNTLMLIGDGGLMEKYKQKAAENGQTNVIFTGFQENPYAYIKQADLFVCSSFYEGLSTATTEAVILGLPVVSTEVSGAKEILGEHNEYGYVVPMDDGSLYQGIKKMLADIKSGVFRAKIVMERGKEFDAAHTVGRVEDLLDSIVKNNVIKIG